jgi:thiamine pyrophosphate-dependent acetolactate synthase large subunit-like protein
MARELFASSPYYVGISGTFATPIASELLTSATLVVAFGASLNYYTTYLGDIFGKARVVQIDNQATALGKYQHVDVAIQADARVAAAGLADELERRHHHVVGYRSADTAERIAQTRRERQRFADRSSAAGIDPRTLMVALDELLPKERTLVVDVGHFMDFPIAHMSVAEPRAFVWPIEYTAVGSGLGPALGAAVACPDKLTVLCIGDGGMMMTMADLDTAVRYRLRLLIVVCNDSALSGELHFLRESGYSDELARSQNPSFEALARSIGFEAATVRVVGDLEAIRGRVQNLDGPMLLDCRITPDVVADSRSLLGALMRKGMA